MNRGITNVIRFLMDELVPPFVRDSKVFMYPFYYFAYRGRNIKEVMDFKKNVFSYSPQQYADFYNNLNTISRNRATDLNQACVKFVLDEIDENDKSVIDVGCGSGFMLNKVKERYPNIERVGFDIKDADGNESFTYVQGNIEKLPFPDKAFDVVMSSHTIEHLLNLDLCLEELKRITRRKLILVTPCQRYFYYTLDEHVNFFPIKETLTHRIGIENHKCLKLNGDWAYVGYISCESDSNAH
jgi:SAM-dependent methyltransferase